MARSIHLNLKLYPLYAGLFHAYFWLPVYFLFFNSKLDLEDVLLLESVYFFSVVTFEVPSGWFSDTFGRRGTLIAACSFLCASYVVFLFANSFGTFALAQILLAGGIAFNSGTDTSFLFESTKVAGVEEEYANREAVATKFGFLGTACAGVLGGLAAIPDYRGAYALSLLGAIGLLLIAVSFTEPQSGGKYKKQTLGFFTQIIACFRLLRDARLRWLFGFSVFMIVINHIPYEFYQPFIKELASTYEIAKATPLLTSVHLTLTMIIAAWIASRSVRIRDKIGLSNTLFLGAGLQTAIMATMYLFVNIPVAVFTLLRSCPRALVTAPLNAAIAPNVPTERRATFLSLQSLFGRLGFSLTLAMFASIAGGQEWNSIATMLKWGMWCSIAVLIFFVVIHWITPKDIVTHPES